MSDPHSHAARTPQQASAAQEWRYLCFTLEKAQADYLVKNCKDKYDFAKSYLVYGRDYEPAATEARLAAGQGNYAFFTERGIAGDVMTPALAEQMLADWQGAIASKKTLAAEAFQRRFGEELDTFVTTPDHGPRLILSKPYDDTDAVLTLGRFTADRVTPEEFATLRAEIDRLRGELDELRCLLAERPAAKR